MYIEKIKQIGGIDEYGGRSLEIRCKNRHFTTPLRIPTSTEYRYRQDIPIDHPIETPISEIVSDFRRKELEAFLKGNGPFKNRVGAANENALMMSYSGLLFYPQIPSHVPLTIRNRREFIELQLLITPDDKPINLISYPMVWSTTISKEINQLTEEIEKRTNGKSEIVPYIDLSVDVDTFRKSIDLLSEMTKSDSIHTVGLAYRPRLDNIQNYLTLWEKRDDNGLWIHVSGVPRRPYKHNPSAEIHAFQYYGIDSFSIRTIRAFSKSRKQVTMEKSIKPTNNRELDIKAILRFDEESLGYLKDNEWYIDHPKDKICNCPVCDGKNRERFTERFLIGLDGKKDPARVNEASKLHEFYSSSSEFILSQKFIRDGEFADYVKNKKYFPDVKRKPGQSLLN